MDLVPVGRQPRGQFVERRALAAREELVRLGIEPTRVDTKTWGKDNPANDPGHDESAWKKNRRDEFVVVRKMKKVDWLDTPRDDYLAKAFQSQGENP